MTGLPAQARCVAVLEGDPLLGEPHMAAFAAAAGFAAREGEVLLGPGEVPTLWVGCGPTDTVSTASIRESFGAAGRSLGHLGSVEVDHRGLRGSSISDTDVARAVALGLRLGEYRFDVHRPEGRRSATDWVPVDASVGWSEGLALGDLVCAARNAVNEPGNVMTPEALAELAVQVGSRAGLEVYIRDEAWLEEQGAGGILAIGRGSGNRPKMVEIVHAGDRPDVDLCLVGKGVTFDTGGLSLKAADSMVSMQHDMAAVAAILYAMALLPEVAPNLHVRAFCPLVENNVGPHAARPGDIVTSRNGKTIEILNSDFEGRVILADALAFAVEQRPGLLLDLATLTYGAVAALGPRMAALFGDDTATNLVRRASERAGEPVWRLPLQEYLVETVRSRVASVRNFPDLAEARATTAALFLREFVSPGIAWAHLDIAGPAWSARDHGSTAQGGTGFGVQTLLELFTSLADAQRAASSDEARSHHM